MQLRTFFKHFEVTYNQVLRQQLDQTLTNAMIKCIPCQLKTHKQQVTAQNVKIGD